MKKLVALVMAGVLLFCGTMTSYAAEPEGATLAASVEHQARPLGITPYFRIPKLPQVSAIRITPKFNFDSVDFSKYIPTINPS